MTEGLRLLMEDSEINNSFDIESVSATLKMELENSFSYLYRLQRNLIRFKEFYFPTSKSTVENKIKYGDLFLDDKRNVCIQIEADLVGQVSRDRYRHSQFFNKEFTLEDIQNHPEIFERTILLSIDQRYRFDYKIRMENGITRIILPYKMNYLINRTNNVIEHQTSVILVDNEFYKNFRTNKSVLEKMSVDGDIYIGPNYAGIPSFREDGTYVAFTRFNNETGFSLMTICDKASNGYLHVDYSQSILQKIQGSDANFDITIVFMKDMYEHKLYGKNHIIMQYRENIKKVKTPILLIERNDCEPYNMPIPEENFLVLKRVTEGDAVGEYETFHQSGVEIHYPNMYLIKDPAAVEGDIYRVFYFYRKGYDLHYTPKFTFFYRFLKKKFKCKTLEEAVNKAYYETATNLVIGEQDELYGIFRKLFNYIPFDYRYDIIDFTRKYKTDETPYEYKVRNMHEFIADDTKALKDYVIHQNRISESYWMHVNHIDLSRRLRKDTSGEVGKKITFKKDRYVFMFYNESDEPLNMRIWVDGLLCMDVVQMTEGGMDYIYLPVEAVSQDSYIELEIYRSFSFTTNVYFENTEDYKEVNVFNATDLVPTMADIMLIDTKEPAITYSTDSFEIVRVRHKLDLSTRDENDELKLVHDQEIRYTTMDTFKIRALNDTVLHRHITLKFRKNAIYTQTDFDRTGYPQINLDAYDFNNDRLYYRVYRSGRLMPDTMWVARNTAAGKRLQMLFPVHRGDSFAFDITPFRNELIYFVENLPSNQTIDLTGKIDKPFDIRYYDVFLNGAKLNETQVFAVSDTIIRLKNIKSYYHLEIYEKERDEEYFGWTKNNVEYYFQLKDLLSSYYATTEEKEAIMDDIVNQIIKDSGEEIPIKPNENTEEKNCDDDIVYDKYLRHRIFYYEELLPKRLGIPMVTQFNKEYIKSEYPETADVYLIESSEIALEINNSTSSSDKLSNNVLYLDPDINATTAKEVYFLGDYDELCEELEKAEKGE